MTMAALALAAAPRRMRRRLLVWRIGRAVARLGRGALWSAAWGVVARADIYSGHGGVFRAALVV